MGFKEFRGWNLLWLAVAVVVFGFQVKFSGGGRLEFNLEKDPELLCGGEAGNVCVRDQ